MNSWKVSHLFARACHWTWLVGTTLAVGCAYESPGLRETLSRRIEPGDATAAKISSEKAVEKTAKSTISTDPMVSRTDASQEVERRKASGDQADTVRTDLPPAIAPPSSTESTVRPVPQPTDAAPAASADDSELEAIIASGRPLSLHEAIDLAFRLQPRLRAHLESVAQARGRQEIVASLFLPTVGVAGSFGGYDVSAGGSIPVPSGLKPPAGLGFSFLPATGVLPVGLRINSSYELVDFKLQWLITDFGRRLGRFEQAKLAMDVAQFQTDRAFQTVSNEVSVAYYDILKAQALRATAQDAIRRAEEQLKDVQKLEREGVVEREAVLRTEVLLAESRQQLHIAVESEFVALAALNLAIGIKCGEPIRVADPGGLPRFDLALCDCLQAAITNRREFQVALRTVEISQVGSQVAKAEFAPKVIGGGNLIDFRQNSNAGRIDIALGYIRVDWELFEGGRRLAERRLADSRLREAMAQAESIADTIAFQVNEAYRRMNAARLGIEDARPAVDQATENYRLVQARAKEGSATATEITDAHASLTRAQQNYQNSQYAYLTALSKLDYAMGNSPTPATLPPSHP
jgi:outer membrane protein TolC